MLRLEMQSRGVEHKARGPNPACLISFENEKINKHLTLDMFMKMIFY